MAASCSACGCTLSDQALRSGQAVREGTLLFCPDCANLAVETDSGKTKEAHSISAVRRAAGIEVVEEVVLSAAPVASKQSAKKNVENLFDDADLIKDFDPEPLPEARRPSARSSGRPKPGSGTMPKGRPTTRTTTAARPSGPSRRRPAGSERGRAVETDRSARGKASSARPEQSQSERRRPSQRVSQKGSSRMTAPAKRSSDRFREDASSSRSARARVQTRGGLPPTAMIGIGVGLLVVLLIGFMALGNSRSKKNESKPAAQEEFTDSTPAAVWARRGQEKESRGDRSGAAGDFRQAAVAAEREGDRKQGETYNMKAYQLDKFTPLKIGSGR